MGMARRESESPLRSLHVPFESQKRLLHGLVNALLGKQRASERIGPVLLTDLTSGFRGRKHKNMPNNFLFFDGSSLIAEIRAIQEADGRFKDKRLVPVNTVDLF